MFNSILGSVHTEKYFMSFKLMIVFFFFCDKLFEEKFTSHVVLLFVTLTYIIPVVIRKCPRDGVRK